MTKSAVAIFQHWVQHAEYGQDFVYHKATAERDEDVFARARKLQDAGLVFLYQRRAGDGFEHVARRTKIESHLVLDKLSSTIKSPRNRYVSDDTPGRKPALAL